MIPSVTVSETSQGSVVFASRCASVATILTVPPPIRRNAPHRLGWVSSFDTAYTVLRIRR